MMLTLVCVTLGNFQIQVTLMEIECQIQVMLNVDIKAYSRDANTGLCHFGKFPVSGDVRFR